jgi:hypothetical protein
MFEKSFSPNSESHYPSHRTRLSINWEVDRVETNRSALRPVVDVCGEGAPWAASGAAQRLPARRSVVLVIPTIDLVAPNEVDITRWATASPSLTMPDRTFIKTCSSFSHNDEEGLVSPAHEKCCSLSFNATTSQAVRRSPWSSGKCSSNW